MYRNYWYRSGTNQTMRNALADIANKAETLIHMHEGDSVVDIGCNDGTLLACYKTGGIRKIGFDPAENLAVFSRKIADKLVVGYFEAETFQSDGDLRGRRPKIVTSIAMFYDLENPNKFVSDIKKRDGPGGALDRPDELSAVDAEDERVRQHLPRAPRILLPEVVRVPSEPARVRDRRRGTERHQRRKPAGVHPEPERRSRTGSRTQPTGNWPRSACSPFGSRRCGSGWTTSRSTGSSPSG